MTSPADLPPEDDLLAAEYALGVLPQAERLALQQRLDSDANLARRVWFWEEQLTPLGAAIEPVQPPAQLLAEVERRIFPAAPESQGLWNSLRFWRGLSAALLCLFIIAGGSTVFMSRPSLPVSGYVAELSGTDASLRLVAYYDARSATLKLNRVAGVPAAGRDYQLWVIEGQNPPVSLGVLPADPVAALKIPPLLAARLGAKAVLAVSDEPKGGSPTGLPTGAVLAAAPLTGI